MVPVTYQINDRDEITQVNEGWNLEAKSYNLPELAPGQVVGKILWSFFSDVTTEEMYRHFVRKARRGRSFRFPFRCDDPDARRVLEMNIRQVESNGIEFSCYPIQRETRPYQPLLGFSTPRSQEFVRFCSWCHRLNISDGWVEVEDAAHRLGLLEHSRLPKLSHGMCPGCQRRILDELHSVH